MTQIGITELIIILVIAVLIFGPKKLPGLGAGLGKAIRDFKGAISGKDESSEDDKKVDKKDDTKS